MSTPLPGRLAVRPRPSGEHELNQWKAEGACTVVSLLTLFEEVELGLESEAADCDRLGIEFLSLPITDRGLPESAQAVDRLISALKTNMMVGKSVVIHCRMGIGRSGLIAACLLCRLGYSVSDAFAEVSRSRGVIVPDMLEQREWVERFVLAT